MSVEVEEVSVELAVTVSAGAGAGEEEVSVLDGAVLSVLEAFEVSTGGVGAGAGGGGAAVVLEAFDVSTAPLTPPLESNVFAFFTASAIQLKAMSSGAGLLILMVNPFVVLLRMRN